MGKSIRKKPTRKSGKRSKKSTSKQRDPKFGTGKKPKGSGRRLYTNENPKDTVSIKYATPADARATVKKVKNIKKTFARKIQILTVMEQRARVAGKKEQEKIAQKGKEAIRRMYKKKRKSKCKKYDMCACPKVRCMVSKECKKISKCPGLR